MFFFVKEDKKYSFYTKNGSFIKKNFLDLMRSKMEVKQKGVLELTHPFIILKYKPLVCCVALGILC